jgi:hypothetical protein
MSDGELEHPLLPTYLEDAGEGEASADEEAAVSEAPSLQRTLTRWDGISLTVGVIIGAQHDGSGARRTLRGSSPGAPASR